MSSNSKPKPNAKEAPTEPFKRAVAGCLRALARRPDLDVSYAAERPGLAAGKARLPEPARKLTPQEAAIVRGHADSIALRVACHDASVHRRAMPIACAPRPRVAAIWASCPGRCSIASIYGCGWNPSRRAR